MDVAPRLKEASYLSLHHSGMLRRRAEEAVSALAACALCPRACTVNRLDDKTGYCGVGRYAAVSSATPHFGEEPGISGVRGSGTIFFNGCNLACVFCQNHEISQPSSGGGSATPVSAQDLARVMLDLQDKGCHNINLVSPSHVVAQIIEALPLAVEGGLRLPLVYNSNGYDSLAALDLLDGLVDIYLPDFKYLDNDKARRCSGVDDYADVAPAALRAMHRQVGDPVEDDNGLIRRGLIIRHLVLPHGLSDTPRLLGWIAATLGVDVYISLMSQYFPTHRAVGDPLLGQPLDPDDYDAALKALAAQGLDYGWRQQPEAADYYRPDFSSPEKPFKDIDDFTTDAKE